jgi:hypothetical protein
MAAAKSFSNCKTLLSGLWLVAMIAPLCGCVNATNPADALAAANSSNIQRLVNLYIAFQMQHNWRGPANEGEFKQFVQGVDPKKLERIGIDVTKIDNLFVNERDNQPFKIKCRVPGNMMGASDPVIFEAEGVDGKRLVGRLNMTQEETDAATYDQLWGAKPVKVAGPQRETAGS